MEQFYFYHSSTLCLLFFLPSIFPSFIPHISPCLYSIPSFHPSFSSYLLYILLSTFYFLCISPCTSILPSLLHSSLPSIYRSFPLASFTLCSFLLLLPFFFHFSFLLIPHLPPYSLPTSFFPCYYLPWFFLSFLLFFLSFPLSFFPIFFLFPSFPFFPTFLTFLSFHS